MVRDTGPSLPTIGSYPHAVCHFHPQVAVAGDPKTPLNSERTVIYSNRKVTKGGGGGISVIRTDVAQRASNCDPEEI
jgi:hypothetical protein